jgi:hypothetical protein
MDVDSICDTCYHFWTDEHDPEGIRNMAHGEERDTTTMTASADAGCHCCAIFLANVALNESVKDLIELGDNINRFFVMFHKDVLNLLGLFGDGTARTRLRFALQNGDKDFVDRLGHSECEPSTGSASSFAQAKQWMRQCDESHSACRSSDLAYCPSRLLYIDRKKETLGLRTRNEIPARAKYAALSHCWGGVMPLTLNKENRATLQEGIPFSQLAQTFQDAIRVCQEFEIDYMWIDCFTIAQDDLEDWRAESVTMQKIYGNAYLTIAATDAKNSGEGLFRERHIKALQPFKLSVLDMMPAGEMQKKESADDLLKTFEESTGNPGAISYLTDIEQAWERLEQSPLNRRGWAIQERILSPRVLHYDKDQLVWECDTLSACERFPGPTGVEGLVDAKKRVRASVDKLRCMQVVDRPIAQELHDSWKPIIKAYSSAGLTKQTDRLIAIEGIAQWLAQTYSSSYVAGLFTLNMESQLAWKLGDDTMRQKQGSKPRVPDTKVAPSWSWASFLGEIEVLPQWQSVDSDDAFRALEGADLRETVLCEITNKATLAVTWSPLNTSTSLPLEVSCFLAPIHFVSFDETKTWPEGKHEMVAWPEGELSPTYNAEHLPFDESRPTHDLWPLASSSGGGGTTGYAIHEGNPHSNLLVTTPPRKRQADAFFVAVDFDIWEDYRAHRSAYLLPCYEVTKYEALDLVEKTHKRVIQGVVLQREITTSSGGGENSFRRIGMFTLEAKQRAPFWRACVESQIAGLQKHVTSVGAWPVVDCGVAYGTPFVYEERERAERYHIAIL